MKISDLARRWIAANFITMVATAAFGFLGFGIRYLLDVESADAALSAKICYVAVEIIMTAAAMALYAQLTGAVLRRIVPAFPWRSWLAVHLVIGLVAGVLMGVAGAAPGEREPIDWADTGFLLFLCALMPVAGAMLGAVVGGLQALILRRVAHGAGTWIAFSSLATGVMLPIVVFGALPFSPSGPTFAAEVIMECVGVLGGVIAAVVMLPALRRLRPRTTAG